VVQKGDTLTKIAKKFNTTTELISKANNLANSNLNIGKKLKITKAKFSIVVDKSQNILTLKTDQEIFKTYHVSTGKGGCTPVGVFKVTNKLIDPPWYPTAGGMIPAKDPRNELGSRWLGISKQGYGIHGTTDPDSIGKSVTEGCVRLRNAEVEELYAIVPVGTEVVIID
jgi:lipoprotein-anchoring transpeptidase ErfK/SrfK